MKDIIKTFAEAILAILLFAAIYIGIRAACIALHNTNCTGAQTGECDWEFCKHYHSN